MNPGDLSKQIDEENIKVTMDDFRRALKEVEPPLRAASNTLEMCRFIICVLWPCVLLGSERKRLLYRHDTLKNLCTCGSPRSMQLAAGSLSV